MIYNLRPARSIAAALAALVAASLCAQPASAARMLATYAGVVDTGTDATNAFGLGGTLDGARFTAQFKFDTTLGTRTTTAVSDQVVGGPFWGGVSPIFYSAITINGLTETFNTGQDGSANVFDQTTIFGRWAQTFVYSQFDAWTATTGDHEFLQLFVLDAPSPLSLTTPFTGSNIAVLTPPIVTNTVSKYRISGGIVLDDYSAVLDPRTLMLRAIPEPATWMMLIGGFAAIGAAARRSRRTFA